MLPNSKCGGKDCPLINIFDTMREQADLQVQIINVLWDNVKRLSDMAFQRGCPDICPSIIVKNKKTI